MASLFKYAAAWANICTILGSELNSLADNGYSTLTGVGTGVALDNTASLNTIFRYVVDLASLTPTGSPFITVYAVAADAAGTYEDTVSSTNTGRDKHPIAVTIGTGAGAKKAISAEFTLGPGLYKFVARSDLNVAMAASGNVIKIEACNRGAVAA